MYQLRNEGLGVFNPPVRPNFIDPGYPPDPGIVALNTANNNAFQVAMDIAQASNNYDQCELNAQNAKDQAQYDEVMARCRGQAAQQAAPDVPTTTYYTPGQPISYSPGGPAIATPVYSVPTWAAVQPTFTPPISLAPPPVSTSPAPAPTPSGPAPAGSSNDSWNSLSHLGEIPVWAWAAAAGVALFAFGGGRGR